MPTKTPIQYPFQVSSKVKSCNKICFKNSPHQGGESLFIPISFIPVTYYVSIWAHGSNRNADGESWLHQSTYSSRTTQVCWNSSSLTGSHQNFEQQRATENAKRGQNVFWDSIPTLQFRSHLQAPPTELPPCHTSYSQWFFFFFVILYILNLDFKILFIKTISFFKFHP